MPNQIQTFPGRYCVTSSLLGKQALQSFPGLAVVSQSQSWPDLQSAALSQWASTKTPDPVHTGGLALL